jgi:hypothetical protein
MKTQGYLLLCVLLIFAACGPKTTSTGTTGSGSKYSEDLSVWRPKSDVTDTIATTGPDNRPRQSQYVEPKFAVNESLDAVLDSISEVNLAMGHVDGFTIQVYSGLKREEALSVKKQMAETLPQLEAEVQYAQPNFRVRAGKYFDRFEALHDYQVIKRHFPNAILLPERIPIR